MKEIHLWNFIHSNLKKNIPVILVAVVDHTKGSPGKRGFKMAVSSIGDSAGSVGGGVMEYNIIKSCRRLLEKGSSVNKLETLYHNKKSSVKQSGLICAGSQTNFTISLTKKDIKSVKKILNAVKDQTSGKIIFSNKGITFNPSKKIFPYFSFEHTEMADWKFEQASAGKKIVYVVGSGHVGLAVCRVLSLLDFHVVAYDSRNDLKTYRENIYADKKITGAYKNLGKIIKPDSYVVIVTTGFDSDKEALEQVLNKKVRYIGLMGTKAKIKKIINEAVKDGVNRNLLDRIHAPIGIDISSDTPEEIAISIAAEIIKIKNSS